MFTKLKDLIDQDFTIEEVQGFKYKMWSDADKRMVVSDGPKEGHRKVYQVQTDKGLMDLSTFQIGNLLECVFEDGSATLIGRTFHVKSNGKTGKEIFYFFNEVK